MLINWSTPRGYRIGPGTPMAFEVGKSVVKEGEFLCHLLEGDRTLTDRSDSF